MKKRLTEDQIKEALEALKLGKSQTEIAVYFGVTRGAINQLSKRLKLAGHTLPKVKRGTKAIDLTALLPKN